MPNHHCRGAIVQYEIFHILFVFSLFVRRSCISRHLMNNKECFFCKHIVNELEDITSETSAKK